MQDIFELQDEIASKVVGKLRVTLLGEIGKAKQADTEAYNLYLMAKHLNYEHRMGSSLEAERLVRKSIEIDSNYAPAWYLLGALVKEATINLKRYPTEEGLTMARQALLKSISVDSVYAPA